MALGAIGCAGQTRGHSQGPTEVAASQSVELAPLPEVAAGRTCGWAEVTLDRGAVNPPLRFEFRPDAQTTAQRDDQTTAQSRGGYTVDARITDYNGSTCWVAVRVTRDDTGASKDIVLHPEVGTSSWSVGSASRGISSPDLKDPMQDDVTVSVRRGVVHERAPKVVVTAHPPIPSFIRTAPDAAPAPAPATGSDDGPMAARDPM